MNMMSKSSLAFAVLCSMATPIAHAQSQQSLCYSTAGYTLAFFNGVWNTPQDALLSLDQFKFEAFGFGLTDERVYNGNQVSFTLMYNSTGNLNDKTLFQDIAEVFIQRGEEIGFNPKRHFHVYWDAVTGNKSGFFNRVKTILGETALLPLNLLDELYGYTTNKSLSILSDLFSNPPTSAEYDSHNATLNRIVLEGQRIVMVAHSQGNLFLNNAYNKVVSQPNYSPQNVAAIHVAPASVQLSGEYVLADIDAVINGLRLSGYNSVPPNNVELPISHLVADPSGHTFIGTYLNRSLPALGQIKNKLYSAMDALHIPEREVSPGSFSATLLWDRAGDVDLHAFEPNGAQVYYSRKNGPVGYLDRDDITGTGPEHYYASCDPYVLEDGVYMIGVNNYGAPAGTTVTLQISTPQVNELILRRLTLGEAKGSLGNANPTPLATVTVSKDIFGKIVINAH